MLFPPRSLSNLTFSQEELKTDIATFNAGRIRHPLNVLHNRVSFENSLIQRNDIFSTKTILLIT